MTNGAEIGFAIVLGGVDWRWENDIWVGVLSLVHIGEPNDAANQNGTVEQFAEQVRYRVSIQISADEPVEAIGRINGTVQHDIQQGEWNGCHRKGIPDANLRKEVHNSHHPCDDAAGMQNVDEHIGGYKLQGRTGVKL